jgi:predicted solute-binding protein
MSALPPFFPANTDFIDSDGGMADAVTICADVRIGSVPYLNARPLTRGLRSPVTKLEPSALAAEMRAGRIDVGLVPLMEVLEAPAQTYKIARGMAIGAQRAVYSVYVNHVGPLAKIETVALDPASKTSVELTRVVLEKFHRLKPRYVAAGEPADAQVLIGDPAIVHRQAFPEQNYLDLGEEWREFTGLPFVFAVWAMRLPFWRGLWVSHQLRRAKAIGLAQRGLIARNAFERQYLTEHLCYDLGPRQKKAIALFGAMLHELGRLPETPKVSYL